MFSWFFSEKTANEKENKKNFRIFLKGLLLARG